MFALRWMWVNLKNFRLLYVTGLILSAVTVSMSLISPKLFQILIDEVVVGVDNVRNTSLLLPLIGGIVAAQLLRTVLRYFMTLSLEHSSQGFVRTLQNKLYQNLQSQEMSFFDRNRTGDLMTRMTGDVDMLRHTLAHVLVSLFESVFLFIISFAFLMTVNPLFTVILISITPFLAVVSTIISKKVRPLFRVIRDRLSDMNTVAQENISGNRVVKAFAREEFELEKFRKCNEEFKNANLKANYKWMSLSPIIEFLSNLMMVIITLVGGLLIIKGSLTPGELAAFTSLSWALANPLRVIPGLLNDFQRFFASANKVIEIFYSRSIIADREDCVKIEGRLKGDIKFSNVSFWYSDHDDKVFDNISFEIKEGQTVGIMGPTGSGKTTIANLLMRMYDIKEGSITIDGVDIRMVELKKLRSSIGVATQDVFLFSDTIDGNISYGNPDLPEEQVRHYARIADADKFIRETPEGYETIIGERGVGLSGGQKQRISLARALAIRPPILILDDTTSAVDMETEAYIQKQLENLDFPCTKIIIAQRISSVRNADLIIVLGDNGIEEMGTHDELIKSGGYYSQVFRLQTEGMPPEAGNRDYKEGA